MISGDVPMPDLFSLEEQQTYRKNERPTDYLTNGAMNMTKPQRDKTPAERIKAAPKTTAPAPKNRTAIAIAASSEEEQYEVIARTLTRPEIGAAAIIEAWSPKTHDVNLLATELAAQVKAVNQGDMQRTEAILISQAQALDAIFVNLMRRSMNQQSMLQWEAYMRMGMKAQSQCRATLQALAEMKNPRPVAFVKQANINNGGHQQINNGVPVGGVEHSAPARETLVEQTKLLDGVGNGSTYMDAGATPAASRSNKTLEPVGAINRAKKQAR